MKVSLGAARPLLFPTPVLLVGTYDENSKPNLATVAWGGVCNSDPASVTVCLRQATWTHHCILDRRAFTVNLPHAGQVREADYIGIASGRDADKFAAAGFTPVKSGLVDAPYVQECRLILECELVHHQDLGLHTLFVGKIMDIKADEEILKEAGKKKVDILKLDPIIYDVGGAYNRVGEVVGHAFSDGKELMK